MLADLQRLIDLQQADLRLRDLQNQIALFPQRRGQAERELAEVRQQVQQARNQHTENLKARKKLELDVQQLEERIGKHKTQIYEVKSNEAYRALQEEITDEEKNRTQAEDRVLEVMIADEELEGRIKEAEASLKQVEQRIQAALKQLGEEEAAVKKDAAEVASRRDELRDQIGEEPLAMYDRIAKAHGGIALAEARDEVCQVCRIHIRPQTFAEVKRNDEIRYCESCHRILYYLPPPAPTEADQAAAVGN
jgi:predicted  nucleic acid-binding Zn-ribbon protein